MTLLLAKVHFQGKKESIQEASAQMKKTVKGDIRSLIVRGNLIVQCRSLLFKFSHRCSLV